MKYFLILVSLFLFCCSPKRKLETKEEKIADNCRNFTNEITKKEFERLGKLYKSLETKKHTNYCFIEQEIHDMSINEDNESYYATTTFYLKFYTNEPVYFLRESESFYFKNQADKILKKQYGKLEKYFEIAKNNQNKALLWWIGLLMHEVQFREWYKQKEKPKRFEYSKRIY